MDTVADIINSIPEPLATAILTATFTGLVIFFLQKRIENLFAEKVEEFKVNLQKSLFEHQTKFERHHEKAVGALENSYQILIVICNKYEGTVYGCMNFYKDNLEFIHSMDLRYLGLEMRDIAFLNAKSNEFLDCLNSNRLFLTPRSIHTLKTIHERVDILIQLVPHYLNLLFRFNSSSPEHIYSINQSIEVLGFGVNRITEHWDFLLLFDDFVEEMKIQTEKLERLYKSVADIPIQEPIEK